LVADLDQVPQPLRRLVAGGFPLVGALPSREPAHPDHDLCPTATARPGASPDRFTTGRAVGRFTGRADAGAGRFARGRVAAAAAAIAPVAAAMPDRAPGSVGHGDAPGRGGMVTNQSSKITGGWRV